MESQKGSMMFWGAQENSWYFRYLSAYFHIHSFRGFKQDSRRFKGCWGFRGVLGALRRIREAFRRASGRYKRFLGYFWAVFRGPRDV